MGVLKEQGINILVEEINRTINTKINAIKGSNNATDINMSDGTSVEVAINKNKSDITDVNTYLSKSENTKYQTENGIKEFTSKDGYIDNVFIEGKTLVNLIDKNATVEEITIVSRDMYNSKIIDASPAMSIRNHNLQDKTRSNTVTLINDFEKQVFFRIENNSNVLVRDEIVAINSKKVLTLSDNECISDIYYDIESNEDSSESLKNSFKKSVMVLQGNHIDKPITYFEGLKSIGQGDKIEILSYKSSEDITPTNLTFTDNKYIECSVVSPNYAKELSFNGVCYTNEFIEVDTNTQYIMENVNSNIVLYDANKNMINKEVVGSLFSLHNFSKTNGIFCLNTDNLVKFIKPTIRIENKDIFKIYKNSKYDKKQILCTLRSLPSGVKDTIEKRGDKYYKIQRCGEITLNGDIIPNEVKRGVSATQMTEFRFAIGDLKKGIDHELTNTLTCGSFSQKPHSEWSVDKEAIFYRNDGNVYFHILSSKVNYTLLDVVNYLKYNPITVVYELETPKIIPLPNFNPRTFEPNTTFILNSGVIQGECGFEVTNSLGSSLEVIKDKLDPNYQRYKLTEDDGTGFNISNQDANNLMGVNKVFFGENITNSPRKEIGTWWTIENFVTNNYGHQISTAWHTEERNIRYKRDNIWQPWRSL